MSDDQIVRSLAALAHPLRLKIFRALVVVGAPGLNAGTIQEGVGVPPATLSFHLKELTNSGLVTVQRVARNTIYRAAYDQMNGLLGYLTENCCQGAECAVDRSPAAACGCQPRSSP
jgi:ArsR family transcriptional regulator, arsenate/arsenite/antimonite-responsive transcriptional repressor